MNSDIGELRDLLIQLEKFPGIESRYRAAFNNIVAGLKEKVDDLSNKVNGKFQPNRNSTGEESQALIQHGLSAGIERNSRSNLIILTIDDVKSLLSPLENGSKAYVQKDFSNKFYTNYYGYRMYLGIDFYKDKFNLYIKLCSGDYDDLLPWPFSFKTEIILLNQVEESKSQLFHLNPTNHSGWERPLDGSTNNGIGFYNYVSLSDITTGASYVSDYLRNNKLYFQIKVLPDSGTSSSIRSDLDQNESIETLSEEFKCHSFDTSSAIHTRSNIFIFTVGGVSSLLNNLKDGSISCHNQKSSMFYSSHVGYKMRCDITIDQEYVKARIVLAQGRHDRMLLWPFQKRIRLVLINQVERCDDRMLILNSKPTARPINENQQNFVYCMERDACDINMFPTRELDQYEGISDFLRNDRLHIQIKVID